MRRHNACSAKPAILKAPPAALAPLFAPHGTGRAPIPWNQFRGWYSLFMRSARPAVRGTACKNTGTCPAVRGAACKNTGTCPTVCGAAG
ncbi:hypothetical protein B5F10_14820 [Anaerotruncus colihominis]|nr:hypothetical protein B5F10_14820 [Anaerotruncus colihominis]